MENLALNFSASGTRGILFTRALLRHLTEKASEITAIPVDELRGPSRQRDTSWTRFAIMAVARERGKSYPQLGGYFNQRDHTSAMHGVRRAYQLERSEADFACLLNLLRREADR